MPRSHQNQTTNQAMAQAMAPARGDRHKVATIDEYGLRYDKHGQPAERGHVIAPPHTLPGARVLP